MIDLADRLGVRDRLRLLGFRDDVENVYGAADVVAVPSTEPDPLPGAAIEAAAAGCAVVASAHGGLPEIIRDGQTGRLVTPGDASALALAAAELIDDPAAAARLGAAAAADVRERFAPTAAGRRAGALRRAVAVLAGDADAVRGDPVPARDGDRADHADRRHDHAPEQRQRRLPPALAELDHEPTGDQAADEAAEVAADRDARGS